MNDYKLLQGDCLEVLKTLPDQSVQMCVTSPPYYGLRDYGVDGQIGLEETPEAYTEKMVVVFREVRRVLRDDGTLWLNLGDSYFGSRSTGVQPKDTDGIERARQTKNTRHVCKACGKEFMGYPTQRFCSDACGGKDNTPRAEKYGIKPKDLIGIPWRVAFALQADGWYLRSDIIWHKPNPMPESVKDRPTKAHEYIFLMSKSGRYYYDADAIKIHSKQPNDDRGSRGNRKRVPTEKISGIRNSGVYPMANRRSVWRVTTKPFKGAHFAVFPPALITPCILAGSARGDTVLDPFNGSGTTGVVCMKYERDYIGIDLNPDYIAMSRKRIVKERAQMHLF